MIDRIAMPLKPGTKRPAAAADVRRQQNAVYLADARPVYNSRSVWHGSNSVADARLLMSFGDEGAVRMRV